jgi:DNA-directed RNA polymerase subunit RPC12/RpoP
MEIRDPEKLVKFITEIQQDPNVLVRLQDDGTIDLLYSNILRLEPVIEKVKCPYCGILVREHQEPLEDTIRGLYIRCPECGQRLFVHLYVPFGGTVL